MSAKKEARAIALLREMTATLESWGHGMDCPAPGDMDDNERIGKNCDCGANEMIRVRRKAWRFLRSLKEVKP